VVPLPASYPHDYSSVSTVLPSVCSTPNAILRQCALALPLLLFFAAYAGARRSIAISMATAAVSTHRAALVLLLSVLAAAHTPLPDTQKFYKAPASKKTQQNNSWTTTQHVSDRPPPPYPAGKCMRCSVEQLKPSCPEGKCKSLSRWASVSMCVDIALLLHVWCVLTA
jgi:hypothetical protein